MKLSKEAIVARAKVLAKGHVTAEEFCHGPETGFEPFWLPRLCGGNVRNSDDPEEGFETRDAAVAAGKKYRDGCREFVKRNQGAA